MDYANGKIYMLEPICEYEEGDVYYGSTTSTLVKRLSQHKCLSNTAKSKYLVEKYGRDNIKIVLMENYPCNSKDELKAVEAKYQRGNKCVNTRIEGRTKKEYRQDNIDELHEKQKKYRQNNRDKLQEKQKKYYQANRVKVLEHQKEYQQANRVKLNEYQKKYRKLKKESIAN
jgi:hypothetical protein